MQLQRREEVCKLNYDFLLSCCSSATEDYSISAELPPAKKTRTVGIVEPRVVVKIPWTKIGRKTLPQENYKMMMQVSTPMQETAPETIKVHQSNVSITHQHLSGKKSKNLKNFRLALMNLFPRKTLRIPKWRSYLSQLKTSDSQFHHQCSKCQFLKGGKF